MPRIPRGEQLATKALARLAVDHSPPPGSQRRKRQKVHRGVGHSLDLIRPMESKPSETGSAMVHRSEKDYSNGDAASVEHDDPVKPPVKNKVQSARVLIVGLKLI